jgi:cell division protein FtsB
MTLGDVVQVFTTLHIAEERAKAAERQQQLAFELGRKVEALETLQKENEKLVAELDRIQNGIAVVTSSEGRSILAMIISNNKKATDLKSVIAELKGKMR